MECDWWNGTTGRGKKRNPAADACGVPRYRMRSTGFEPVTFGSGGQRSIQLSYERTNGWRNKPSSVPLARGGSFLCERRLRRRQAAYPGLGRSGQLLVPAWPCSGWGLPCHSCYQERGALLPHPFTLACAPSRGPSAVCSLLHFPSPCDARALPGTLPCGARTFLDTPKVPRSSLATREKQQLRITNYELPHPFRVRTPESNS